ncbi:hypothetical protein BU24DRAFT_126166 [Aaosphaeria arxii CBS 175.79]|uniref:Uncharacterized protein n=1 Tax=Aaosphaeria arxii CBS 175.79 TaxID=1450172 RepID=A0A6A5Y3X6_9PLEO|nr:uncharacterized protein BU24DRAFT_126166 [Aaosphaeria arxii CBS 175.79]KAF2019727.1 hypothetical protein BU24DRAFT_126166 [Aaosphaeria arxii CBS 175.79]
MFPSHYGLPLCPLHRVHGGHSAGNERRRRTESRSRPINPSTMTRLMRLLDGRQALVMFVLLRSEFDKVNNFWAVTAGMAVISQPFKFPILPLCDDGRMPFIHHNRVARLRSSSNVCHREGVTWPLWLGGQARRWALVHSHYVTVLSLSLLTFQKHYVKQCETSHKVSLPPALATLQLFSLSLLAYIHSVMRLVLRPPTYHSVVQPVRSSHLCGNGSHSHLKPGS